MSAEVVTGGQVYGHGWVIIWQDGPLVDKDGKRGEPNGATVEQVLTAVRDRLAAFQQSPLACEENAEAIDHIDDALQALQDRTRDREARGVEGSYQP